MPFQCDLGFSHECAGQVSSFFTNLGTLLEGLGFAEAKTENDDQDRWASTEPE